MFHSGTILARIIVIFNVRLKIGYVPILLPVLRQNMLMYVRHQNALNRLRASIMNRQNRQTFFITLCAMALSLPSLAQTPDSQKDTSTTDNTLICGPLIYGDWVTTDGVSRVNIHDCENDKICGEISFLSDPTVLDRLNADPALRDRQILGSNLLSEFSTSKKNKYKGKIYNPEDGKTYKSNIKLDLDNRLKVKGCLGPFCKTQYWNRPENCSSLNG